MIRWRKVGVVAGFEFRSETRRISYLIMVFGMPLFMLAYGGFIGLFSLISKRSGEGAKVYGVVDRSGLLSLTGDLSRGAVQAPPELRQAMERMPSSPGAAAAAFGEVIVFRPFAGEADAMGALRDKSIRGWFLLAEDYLESGRVDRYVADGVALGSGRVERVFRALLTERLLAGRVADQVAARVLDPMDGGGSFTVGPDGKVSARSKLSIVAAIVVPLGFGILLFFAVFGTATTLIQGTATEKENRVVEILLSSARPDELLAGKLLGLGLAGLIQISVWMSMAGVGGLLFAGTLAAAGVTVPWGAIAAGVVFFLAGYFFLGSLMLGTGSLGGNAKEGQQWSLIWTLLSVVPIAFFEVLLNQPHGTAARVMTWIPFSSPTVVVFRLSIDPDGIAWWEIAGALAVLIASTGLALRIGARLFRIGLLMTGSRVTLKDVLRQARMAAPR